MTSAIAVRCFPGDVVRGLLRGERVLFCIYWGPRYSGGVSPGGGGPAEGAIRSVDEAKGALASAGPDGCWRRRYETAYDRGVAPLSTGDGRSCRALPRAPAAPSASPGPSRAVAGGRAPRANAFGDGGRCDPWRVSRPKAVGSVRRSGGVGRTSEAHRRLAMGPSRRPWAQGIGRGWARSVSGPAPVSW